jgi:hypothetical protein
MTCLIVMRGVLANYHFGRKDVAVVVEKERIPQQIAKLQTKPPSRICAQTTWNEKQADGPRRPYFGASIRATLRSSCHTSIS